MVFIYRSIAVLIAESIGCDIEANTMNEAIDTVLRRPYEIKTIYVHFFCE